jgi:hypothetical protein
MSSRFRDTQKKSSSIGDFSHLLDNHWRNQCEEVIATLVKHKKSMSNNVSEKIQQEIKSLQRQVDQNLNRQLENFIERKLKNELEVNSKRLKKLIDEPIEELTQEIVQRARKVDATEDMAVTSMYKIANFLNKGEFDVSFWQKMKIFSTNFKQYIADYSKLNDNPKNLEKLCLDIKAALEKGKPETVSDLIENYFDSEQKKMEAAFAEVEEAIDKAMQKDGEQLVDELLQNAEKELSKKNPLYRKVKQIETMARRADTVISYFQTNTGEKEEQKKVSPSSAKNNNPDETKNKRKRDPK